MNKAFLLVIACFGISSAAFGYDFRFYNRTNDSVNVRVQLLQMISPVERQMNILPGKAYVFSFQEMHYRFCLGKIFLNNELKREVRACQNASYDIIPAGTPAEPANIDVVPR